MELVLVKTVAQYEAKHSVVPGSALFLSPDEEFLYYSYGWGGAYFAEIRLFQLQAQSLHEESRGPQLFDCARAYAWDRLNDQLACSTFKKLFILDAKNLKLIHKISGIGASLDELAFDKSSKFLVIGSYHNPMVKFIDPLRGELAFRKKLGYFDLVRDGLEDGEILLGYGPSGRIVCYDCIAQKTKYEISCPPFADAVRIGNELIIGVGHPVPYYYISADMVNDKEIKKSLGFTGRLEPANLSSFLPSLEKEELMKLEPRRLAWSIVDHRPESKVKEDAPIPGSEMVHNIVGFARVDLQGRKVSEVRLLKPLPPVDVLRMRLSKSGKKIYLRGTNLESRAYGSVISVDDFSVQCEWVMPEDQILATILNEGERAIIIHARGDSTPEKPQRFSLLER